MESEHSAMSTCAERADHTPDHLPYNTPEQEYREEAERRYREIRDSTDEAISGSDVAAGGFAGTVVAWISTRQRANGLIPTGADDQWFDDYARRSYEAGRRYARTDLATNGISPPSVGIEQSTRHQRALGTLQDRQQRYWRGLATDLREEVRETLRNDVAANATAAEARDAIEDRVEKVGMHRARLIAESEPSWGFNRAYLAEAQEAGVSRVGVDMSWETVGDNRVCADCRAKSGTYSAQQAVQMMESGAFPEHALCRCHWSIA